MISFSYIWKRHIFGSNTIRKKLVLVFLYASLFVLLADILIYVNTNRMIEKINWVFNSNVRINEVSEQLELVQESVYQYLNTKSSESLAQYYVTVEDYEELYKKLNHQVTDNEILLMEKNVYEMSASWLALAEETVQAKRGRKIEKYNQYYRESEELFVYIKDYLDSMNNLQFRYNAGEYQVLQKSFQMLELISFAVLMALIAITTFIVFLITTQLTRPLAQLARQAQEVAAGNFDVELLQVSSGDEVESLSNAFHTMVVSIRDYIDRLKESMEMESQMKERELIMQNHLKDAQLKYLHAQINPHFLFNTLNAGVQLAMMEDAEKTSVYIENVAGFFRYNITDISQDTTIEEEIRLADYYIYILNVRYSGMIRYEKELDEQYASVRMPRMILQPLVENAFDHGIKGREDGGTIRIRLQRGEGRILIRVEDDGKGISQERIASIMEGRSRPEEGSDSSNGIGIMNVMERLRLYYGIEDVMLIESSSGSGACVTVRIPEEGEWNVSGDDC